MKNCLLVSFDLVRADEIELSYSIACLKSYIKQDFRYGRDFCLDHVSINMVNNKSISAEGAFDIIKNAHNIADFDAIFLAGYAWSEYLINPLIRLLRHNNYRNLIGLGGYQIEYSEQPELEYPDCQVFILGYGEKSLLKAITEKVQSHSIRIDEKPDMMMLPSPYLTGEIQLQDGQRMVRMETMRGCPYRCSFCAHRDLIGNKIYHYPESRVFEELSLFHRCNVRKINILDPVFNIGQRSIQILEKIVEIGLQAEISLQTRFENIKGQIGARFLDLCSQCNIHLEFGLQTIQPLEFRAVNRPNNIEHITYVMHELNRRGISYEVSLIYGLPFQTLDSFCESVDFLHRNGCDNIKAYPLMLLKGTELYHQKNIYGFCEKVVGDYHIPVVVSSTTFNESDWVQMREIAENLVTAGRYF